MRVKNIKNYYMIIGNFAYDPVIRGGTKFIRVSYVHNPELSSVHLFSNLELVSSTMTPQMLSDYFNTLVKNKDLIGGGFDA